MKKEQWNEFLERLKYWNLGEGVRNHGTANPIFEVKEKVRVYGLDSQYSENSVWFDNENERSWDDIPSLLKDLDESGEIDDLFRETGDYNCKTVGDYLRLHEFDQEKFLERLGFNEVWYVEEWKHVNTHLTSEGAQRFIDRKQHDYGELKIWVDSLYWCFEFQEVIEAILNGEIGYIEKETNGN